MFDGQSAAVIFQPPHLFFPKFPLSPQLAPLLLSPARNADWLQLISVSVQITREPHAQLSRIHPIVLASPLQVETHWSSDNGVCSSVNEWLVQRVAKTAALRHRVHREA